MKLIVIRHGETDLNREDRLQGCVGPNLGLTANGRAEVAHLRDALAGTPETIYTSPLVRTRETTQILNERFHIPIIERNELRERDFGSLSGKPRSEIDPKLVEDDLEGHYDYRPYGGELVDDVRARVRIFLSSLPEEYDTVIVVTHRGIIRILYDFYPSGALPEMILPASQHIFEIDAHPIQKPAIL
jgi:broad specificity phosphatase PhoE